MKLIDAKKTPTPGKKAKVVVKSGKPTRKKPKRDSKGFLLFMDEAMRSDLDSVAASVKKVCKVNASLSFLIRLAISEQLPIWRSEMKKTTEGRFHAKIRNAYSD